MKENTQKGQRYWGAGEVDRGGEGINELKREIRKIGPERLRKKRAREGNHG